MTDKRHQNDAGESHYIGNNWPEGLTDEILAYSNNEEWPHDGWQPLIESFIRAYKAGDDAGSMTPPSGSEAAGAMWYRPIPKDAPCNKPGNWQSALDVVNYAVVISPEIAGSVSIRITSGGEVIRETAGIPGLNYGSAAGLNLGSQLIELVRDGAVIMSGASVKDIVGDDPACIFNYQVVGLE